MNAKYTTADIDLVESLREVANEEGTIQAGDMLQFTSEPTLHTTTSVARAFEAITGKRWSDDFFS
jgi:hypothetical protein